MNDISDNQNQESNIEIAAAFRLAYKRAKWGKAVIWSTATILSILQLIATSIPQLIPQGLQTFVPSILVSTTLSLIFATTIGKHFVVNRFLKMGGSFQRLHDFNVLGLGTKPSHLDARPSQIKRYSEIWLKKNPDDKPNLAEWWPASVSTVPKAIGTSIALLSTFKWELELRKKYEVIIIILDS